MVRKKGTYKWLQVARGVTYDGVLNVAVDLDLERLTHGLTPDLSLHANALWLHGQGLSTRKVGDFSNVSNVAGYNGVRLQELWLEQSFWRKRASLRLGLLAADAEFFVSSYGSLFLNGTFGAFTFLGANVPTEHLVREVLAMKHDLLALAVTMTYHLPALRAAVRAVRAAAPLQPMAVGGLAFSWAPGVEAELGVPFFGQDAREFVASVCRMFEG